MRLSHLDKNLFLVDIFIICSCILLYLTDVLDMACSGSCTFSLVFAIDCCCQLQKSLIKNKSFVGDFWQGSCETRCFVNIAHRKKKIILIFCADVSFRLACNSRASQVPGFTSISVPYVAGISGKPAIPMTSCGRHQVPCRSMWRRHPHRHPLPDL